MDILSVGSNTDLTRTVSLEERERAAKVMSEYLHQLKSSLDTQQSEISIERARLQVLY